MSFLCSVHRFSFYNINQPNILFKMTRKCVQTTKPKYSLDLIEGLGHIYTGLPSYAFHRITEKMFNAFIVAIKPEIDLKRK